MRWWGALLAGLAVLAGPAPARAHGLKGLSAPDVRFRQTVGEIGGRSLKELRGRLVLLYFFKCHEASSVEQSGRVNDAFVRYQAQGLSVIGLSEDAIGEIGAFLGRNNCSFPGAVDDGFRALAGLGAIGPPTAVLIGPEGRVLWGGTPKELLDSYVTPFLERCIPPIPTDWPPQLAAVTARIGARDLGGALKSLEKASGEVSDATREQVAKAIADHVAAWKALAQSEADAGYWDNALDLLGDVAARCKGSALGDELKAQLDGWKADAAVKQELKACKQCAQAKALELKYQYAAAGQIYRRVVKGFEGTKAAARALAAAEHIEQYGLGNVRPGCEDCRQRRTPCEAHGG